MTKSEAKPAIAAVNELFSKSPDGLREIVRAVMQEMLETEMLQERRADLLRCNKTWCMDVRGYRKQARVVWPLARRRFGMGSRDWVRGAVRRGPGLGMSPRRFAASGQLGRRDHSAAQLGGIPRPG
jgi:hypothetical protein